MWARSLGRKACMFSSENIMNRVFTWRHSQGGREEHTSGFISSVYSALWCEWLEGNSLLSVSSPSSAGKRLPGRTRAADHYSLYYLCMSNSITFSFFVQFYRTKKQQVLVSTLCRVEPWPLRLQGCKVGCGGRVRQTTHH